jgi:serine/threonine protein kinase
MVGSLVALTKSVTHEAEDRITPESNIPVAPGQIIGDRYRIGAIIGEGGMGVVCAATHVALGTPVAVKLIRSGKRGSESVLRFLNEARTAASFKGEHIARVYDVGQLESGEPYLVMEHLDGIGLDAFIKERGPLSQSEAVDIVLQACEGLAEAHAVALVHRDIKPANLFLARRPDGQFVLKILDFGISKRLLESDRQGLTDPGTSLGSPWYMSPEQMKDSSLVDQRADVWSLGVLLFELLTKEWPFSGESVPQVCASVLTAPAPVPSTRRPDIDAGLDAVVLRCLEKDPEKRYLGVAALAEDLQRFATRSVRSSALALGETQPVNDAQSKSERPRTPGSLAPLLSRVMRPRSRWSSAGAVVSLLIVGALVAGFGLPYAREHYGLPSLAELSRARLPWDPVLGADLLDDQTTVGRDFPSPMLLQTITAPVSNDASTATAVRRDAAPVLGPTPEEIRRSTARNRSWQREQESLQSAVDAGLPRVESEDGEGSPNDEH